MKSNTLSTQPEPVKKSYMFCQTEDRIAKRHNLKFVNANVEKLLTPRNCLVCRKMVFITGKKGEKECEMCKEIVHQKCEKFLTLKTGGTNASAEEDRAYMSGGLTVSAVEKENFFIQQETYCIRQQTHALEKLTQQLESNRVVKKCTPSCSTSRTEEHQLSMVSEQSESQVGDNEIELIEREGNGVPEVPSIHGFNTLTVEESVSNEYSRSRSHAHLYQVTFNANTAEGFDSFQASSQLDDQCSTMQQSFDVQAATARDHTQEGSLGKEDLTIGPGNQE